MTTSAKTAPQSMTFFERFSTFAHAVAFVLGFSTIFVLLFGLPLYAAGRALGDYKPVLALADGVLVITFGLITLDVIKFEGLVNAYQAHHGDGSLPCSACAAALQAATGLYRGEFMAGFNLADSPAFEHWKLVRQEHYHWRALEALTRLLDYYESIQDYEQVCRWTLHKLELDPWSEHSYRRRMKALALSGQRGLALHQYRACQDILGRDLGVMPAAETTHLCEQIRDRMLEG